MSLGKSLWTICFLLLFLIVWSPNAKAQSAFPSRVAPSNDTGVQPYGTYSGVAENINLTNGNLNIEIPLLKVPGRNGHDLVITMQYDSKTWVLDGAYDPIRDYYVYIWNREQHNFGLGGAGWRLGLAETTGGMVIYDPNGYATDQYTDFIVTLPNGSKHAIAASYRFGQTVTDSEDATFLRMDVSAMPDYVLKTKEGTAIHFNGSQMGCCRLSKVVDVDGNVISYQYDAVTGLLGSITDTLGRSVSFSYSLAGVSIGYRDSNNQLQTIAINYSTFDFAIGPSFALPRAGLHTIVHGPTGGPISYTLVSSVVLPGNIVYGFSYNEYAELTKINYPAGGYTSYDYQTVIHSEDYSAVVFNTKADFREIIRKHECAATNGDCSVVGTADTTYTPTIADVQRNNDTMDVTDGEGNRRVSPR